MERQHGSQGAGERGRGRRWGGAGDRIQRNSGAGGVCKDQPIAARLQRMEAQSFRKWVILVTLHLSDLRLQHRHVCVLAI